jgi:hypothetical protein
MRYREIAKTHDIVFLVSATGGRIPIVSGIIEGMRPLSELVLASP